MALCPFAVKKLIPPGSSDPRITVGAAILHVDAGNATSLYNLFTHDGGIEAHFFVRKDGRHLFHRRLVQTGNRAFATRTPTSVGTTAPTDHLTDGFQHKTLPRWVKSTALAAIS